MPNAKDVGMKTLGYFLSLSAMAMITTSCWEPKLEESEEPPCIQWEGVCVLEEQVPHLLGPRLSDTLLFGIKPMALGGRQEIRVATGFQYNSPSYSLPLMIVSDEEVVEIERYDSASLELFGKEIGVVDLELSDPDIEAQFDSVPLEVAEVTHVEIEPPGKYPLFLSESDAFNNGQQDQWALFAGASSEVFVRLYAGDVRLVDQSMQIDGGTVEKWDRLVIDSADGEASISVKLGNGSVYEVIVPIVSEIDEIQKMESNWDSPEITLGEFSFYCFSGSKSEMPVVGLDWTFEAEIELGMETTQHCAQLTPSATGEFIFRASSGGRSKEYIVTVVE